MSLKTRNAISIVVMTLLMVGLFIFTWKVVLFGPKGDYTVKAIFNDSGGITKNSDVKIGGVPAGSISDIELTKDDKALVTMKLDEGDPIGAGARANSRPVNLLGEKYIELMPGDMRQKQPSGVTIPVERTARPVELDDMLNILQPNVRARLRIIFNEVGIALGDRGRDLNRTLETLPPALDEAQKFVGDFSADNGALKRSIEASDRVLGSFNRENESLKALVSSATGTLRITADKRKQIGATLREAPGTLSQLQTTLTDLGASARELEPMSREVRNAAPLLTTTLDRLPDFQKDAEPALEAARRSADPLRELGRQGTGPVRRLNPVLGRLDTFAQRLKPVVDIADKEEGLAGLFNVMNNWANVVQPTDGLGHTFGTQITVDRSLVTNLVERYLTIIGKNKKKSGGNAPLKSTPPPSSIGDKPINIPSAPNPVKLDLPETIKLPDLPKLVQKLPVPKEVKKLLQNVTGTVDEVLEQIQTILGKTGLLGNKNQQQGSDPNAKGPTGKLIDYLLGP